MNENLKENLKDYFYEKYQQTPRSEEGREEYLQMYKALNGLGLDWDNFDYLEKSIGDAIEAMELQSFLHGYEYCLTMLNLSGGGYGKWLMKLSKSITTVTVPRYPPGSCIAS